MSDFTSAQLNELFGAVMFDDVDKTKTILEKNPSLLNAHAEFSGHTPLMFTGNSRSARGVNTGKLLVENGADIDAQDQKGFTALYHAAAVGNADVVRMLLEAGADPNLPTFSGMTAIEVAEANGRQEVVALF